MATKPRTTHTPGSNPPAEGADTTSTDAPKTDDAPAAAPAPKGKAAKAPKTDDAADASREALEREVAALKAMVQALVDRGTAQADPEAPAKPVKLIGDDLRPMTSSQVMAAIRSGQMVAPGRAVMCADGYLTGH